MTDPSAGLEAIIPGRQAARVSQSRLGGVSGESFPLLEADDAAPELPPAGPTVNFFFFCLLAGAFGYHGD